jgi:hypothetical protein
MEGSTLLDSRTHSTSARVNVDTGLLATSLFPAIDDLPFFVPTNINFSLRSAATDNRFATYSDGYRRSGLSIDSSWETPIGETMLSYWHDRRITLSDADATRVSETIMLSHSVSRGNWRFGADAMLYRTRGIGSNNYRNNMVSFGQSIAYSVKDGPELRITLGQDRGNMRTDSESYVSADSYSSITASLDLSKYLQKRFERDDLRLTFDYRKTVDRSEAEFSLYDELVDRWIDSDRREGFLMSFGMKL